MRCDEEITGIYKIQSILNPEKKYIGSAINIIKRWNCHLSDLKNKKHPNRKLQNHYNKYGQNDFCFSILLRCQKNILLDKEQYYIDKIKPWFNICRQAGNSLGVKRTKKTRKKQSLIKKENPIRYWKGKHHSKETIEKIRETKKGKCSKKKGKTNIEIYGIKRAEEIKEKSRLIRLGKPSPRKGIPCSKETKERISKSLKGYKHTEKAKNNMSVSQYKRWKGEE